MNRGAMCEGPDGKLYWADRLGLLVMEDVPNSWGQPDTDMRAEAEFAMKGMIRRDFNHPAIFSWVLFNETWGLKTKDQGYVPETRDWVKSMRRLAKQLDPSRLVEDNSPCNLDHVETDINSWHTYLPGYAWREHLDQVTRDTSPGSKWNYIGGLTQETAPLLNSECGLRTRAEVRRLSWDYHIMMNEFRSHPVCGWLHRAPRVISRWNGYYRADPRQELGFAAIMPGDDSRLPRAAHIATGTDLRRCAAGRDGVGPLVGLVPRRGRPSRTRPPLGADGFDGLGRRESWSRSQAPSSSSRDAKQRSRSR
jgi:hypothetical protein